MAKKKKKEGIISRRTYLKCKAGGVSAMMALPFLEAMTYSQSAFADGPNDAPLFGTIYEPNGVKQNGNGWFPKVGSSSTNWSMANCAFDQLEAATKQHLTVIRGINNNGGSGNAHMQAISQFLTGFPIANDRITRHAANQGSMTVYLAEKIAAQHGSYKIPYLCLAGNNELDKPNNSVYNNKLKNSLDFSKSGELLNDDRTANLRDVFNRYFAGASTQQTQTAVTKRDAFKLSILDFVLKDAEKLQKILGYSDKQRMDEYLTKVRESEVAINKMYEKPAGAATCQIPSSNTYTGFSDTARLNRLDNHSDQAVKLITLALECGITPGFSYMLGGEAAGCHYQDIGVNQHCHNTISHNASTGNTNYYKINAYNLRIFEKFIKSFKSTQVGGKTLLDRGLFLYGAGLASGYNHSLNNIPLVWAGHANGRVKGGKLLNITNNNDRKTSVQLTSYVRALLGNGDKMGNNTEGRDFLSLAA